MDNFHTRLAVDDEGAPRFRHGSLGKGPSFGAWDVFDPAGGDTRRRRNGDVVDVHHRERPSVSGEQGVGAIQAGAIGVDSAMEMSAWRVDVPVEGRIGGRERDCVVKGGVQGTLEREIPFSRSGRPLPHEVRGMGRSISTEGWAGVVPVSVAPTGADAI